MTEVKQVKDIQISTLLIISLVTGIIAIQLIKSVHSLAFLAFILVWPSFVAAANSVRGMARYGLGTGTSSIGYWGTAVGATMAFMGQFINPIYSPYAEIIAALAVGYITGFCADKIIRMKIPHIELNSMVIAGATSIIAVTVLTLLTGYTVEVTTLDAYITYPLIYIAITLGVLHPYNASLGAGENQRRTLRLAMTEAAMTTALFGLVAILFSDALFWPGLSVLIISIAGFAVFTYRWAKLARAEMYDIRWTGFPPAKH
jgi:tetrahydromethanopterin S-methyltransferase subunit C